MADEIAIEEREARAVVEVAAETRLWKIPKVLASGFETSRAHIEGAGATVEGMPFARFLELDWQSLRGKGAFGQFLDFLTTKQKMRSGMFSSAPIPSSGSAIGRRTASGRSSATGDRRLAASDMTGLAPVVAGLLLRREQVGYDGEMVARPQRVVG